MSRKAASLPDTTLDPTDWSALRRSSHALLDAAIDKLENATQGRVWTPPTDAIRSLAKDDTPPEAPLPIDDVRTRLQSLLPYGVGNTHPRFFGWVHGSGTAEGLLPEIAAAAMNSNCGGRDHAAIHIEEQVLAWSRSIMGFPADSSGLLVSGTSMATIVALKAARDAHCGFTTRKAGVAAQPKPFVGYCAAGAHSCIKRAFDVLGLGSDQLRAVPTTSAFQLDVDALRSAIKADRDAGNVEPFLIVGTAGSVNVGSVDDLAALADVAATEGLWLHIDGAFGAAAMLSDTLRPLFNGLSRAHSLAFDFHKWFHVQYDCGCVLVRDQGAHLKSFSERPDYLAAKESGIAAGFPWPTDLGPELSRGFRALKVWSHFQAHGTARLGAAIARNVEHAKFLAEKVDEAADLERLAPVTLQIVTFRYVPPGHAAGDAVDLDALNDAIAVDLQVSGVAVPSTTKIHGQLALRVNITNHRTCFDDLTLLVEEVLKAGARLAKAHGASKHANGKRKERD